MGQFDGLKPKIFFLTNRKNIKNNNRIVDRFRKLYLNALKRVAAFLCLVIIVTGCSNPQIGFKKVYCFLDNFGFSADQVVHYIAEDSLDLSRVGFKVVQKKWDFLSEKKLDHDAYFFIQKPAAPKLKSIEGLDHCNFSYLGENDDFILYQYHLAFYSKYLGRVQLGKYIDGTHLDQGSLMLEMAGKRQKSAKGIKVIRTEKNQAFPFTLKTNLAQYTKEGYAIESWLALKAAEPRANIAWVQNFKTQDEVSLIYHRDHIFLEDTSTFREFDWFFDIRNDQISTDIFKSYLWNIDNKMVDVKNFQIIFLNKYTGLARRTHIIKSPFIWNPRVSEETWQRSAPIFDREAPYTKVPPNHTGLHFARQLAVQPIMEGDSMNLEFKAWSDQGDTEVLLVFEVSNSLGTIDRHEIVRQVKKEATIFSVSFSLEGHHKEDRFVCYFQNSNSAKAVLISSVQGAIISKNEICK